MKGLVNVVSDMKQLTKQVGEYFKKCFVTLNDKVLATTWSTAEEKCEEKPEYGFDNAMGSACLHACVPA